MTSLQREWEARLEAEGMPAEPRHTSQQTLTNFSIGIVATRRGGSEDGVWNRSLADSERLGRWTQLTHAVHALPADFHNRKLLVTFAEVGYVSKTARQHKVARVTVYRALKALEKHIQKDSL